MNPTVDGSRFRWRGDLVAPGLFVDAPVILMGRKRLESRLIEAASSAGMRLWESVSGQFPRPWPGDRRPGLPLAFSTKFDSLMVMAQDEAAARASGVDELLAISPSAEIPIRQVTAAARPIRMLRLLPHARRQSPSRFRFVITLACWMPSIWSTSTQAPAASSSARLVMATISSASTRRARCSGRSFCLEVKNVYLGALVRRRQSRILAATGRGPWLFMLDPKDGAVLRKFMATEWPDGHGYGGFWEGQIDTQLQIEFNLKLTLNHHCRPHGSACG